MNKLNNEKVCYIQSGWHENIVNNLKNSCVDTLLDAGISKSNIDFVEVPDNTTNKSRQVLQTFNYISETKEEKKWYQRLLKFYKFFDVVSHLLVEIIKNC